LKQLVLSSAPKVAQLEQLRAENEKLRTALRLRHRRPFAEEMEVVGKAREKAWFHRLHQYLKQVGLAVRTWALDVDGAQPPDSSA